MLLGTSQMPAVQDSVTKIFTLRFQGKYCQGEGVYKTLLSCQKIHNLYCYFDLHYFFIGTISQVNAQTQTVEI